MLLPLVSPLGALARALEPPWAFSWSWGSSPRARMRRCGPPPGLEVAWIPQVRPALTSGAWHRRRKATTTRERARGWGGPLPQGAGGLLLRLCRPAARHRGPAATGWFSRPNLFGRPRLLQWWGRTLISPPCLRVEAGGVERRLRVPWGASRHPKETANRGGHGAGLGGVCGAMSRTASGLRVRGRLTQQRDQAGARPARPRWVRTYSSPSRGRHLCDRGPRRSSPVSFLAASRPLGEEMIGPRRSVLGTRLGF